MGRIHLEDIKAKYARALTELAGCQEGASVMSGWLEDLCSLFEEPTEAEDLGARVRDLQAKLKYLESRLAVIDAGMASEPPMPEEPARSSFEGPAAASLWIAYGVDMQTWGKWGWNAAAAWKEQAHRHFENSPTEAMRNFLMGPLGLERVNGKVTFKEIRDAAITLRHQRDQAVLLADNRRSENIALRVERDHAAQEARDQTAQAALEFFWGVYPFNFPEKAFWEAVAPGKRNPQTDPEENLP